MGAEVEIKSLLPSSPSVEANGGVIVIYQKLNEIQKAFEFLKTEEQLGAVEAVKDTVISIVKLPGSIIKSFGLLIGLW